MDRTAVAVVVATSIAVGIAGATAGLGGVVAQETATPESSTQDDPTPTTDPTETADRSIAVTGHGSAEAPPDRTVLSVAVVVAGDDPATVRDDLASGADALRESLANAGVPEERVDTVDYRIVGPDRPPREQPRTDGPAYRGVHGFEVTVDDADRTGTVVDAVADAGAEVRFVAFTLSDERRTELRERALTRAMDDARQQADALAAAGGLQLDGVRHVDAGDRRFEPVDAGDAAFETDDAGGTDVRPDDVTVAVDVRVTYDAVRLAE